MLFIKKKESEAILTLDEAIAHARDVADGRTKNVKACSRCAKEHAQLAEWLKELKEYKERENSKNIEACWDIISDAVNDIMLFGHVTEPTERLIILSWKRKDRGAV